MFYVKVDELLAFNTEIEHTEIDENNMSNSLVYIPETQDPLAYEDTDVITEIERLSVTKRNDIRDDKDESVQAHDQMTNNFQIENCIDYNLQSIEEHQNVSDDIEYDTHSISKIKKLKRKLKIFKEQLETANKKLKVLESKNESVGEDLDIIEKLKSSQKATRKANRKLKELENENLLLKSFNTNLQVEFAKKKSFRENVTVSVLLIFYF